MPVSEGMKAGFISKPYGLEGKVYLILEPQAVKHIKTGHPLFIEIEGQRVPFFLEEMEMVSDLQTIVKFEFTHNLEEARKISGNEVFLDPTPGTLQRPAEDDFSNLIGYKAFNQDLEFIGKVTDYLMHELNPLLVIDQNGRKFLVPAASELILQINHEKRSVHFNLPDGLISL